MPKMARESEKMAAVGSSKVAHQRRHRETGQTLEEHFSPECLQTIPTIHLDYRDSVDALVHNDLRLCFDGNRYCVPPRYVGRQLTVKADSSSVTITAVRGKFCEPPVTHSTFES